ncbi:MAG: hypothetical protein JSS42_09605 [Proteobacteria bacterium]|uniref:hypothetical protein n=1 Tax=Rudaea sp. TaxID=2136325 RepID=UPI00321F98D5|nr:hypothetical protein [Pseudomonadota bacterium]
MTDIGDPDIRAWLMRRLDAQRSAELERRLFVDAELADRIDEAECDLIDDCAHGRLPAADARVVRSRDPWRARFARAVVESQRRAAAPPPRARVRTPRRVGIGVAIAASLLLAVVGLRWQAPVRTHTERTADTASLPVVTLLAGQRRGAPAPLALPTHEGDVRVQAEIEGDAANPSARYLLSVADGENVLFVARNLAPRSAGQYRFVEAVVPATVLGPGARRVAVAEAGAQDSLPSSWDVQTSASR